MIKKQVVIGDAVLSRIALLYGLESTAVLRIILKVYQVPDTVSMLLLFSIVS